MWKLLITTTVAATALLSAAPTGDVILEHFKKNVVKNPQVKVKSFEITETKELDDPKGWEVVFGVLNLEFRGKEINAPEVLFVKGDLATGTLYNLKTGKDYRASVRPTMPKEIYAKSHLLYGNEDAKHKAVVFSDPLCPFCQQTVPKIMEAAKAHPDKIALYYYHLPLLQIHPASDQLTRIMHVAQKKGKKDVVRKIYDVKINARETNTTKIIQAVHKATGFSVSEAEINAKEVKEAIKHDEKMASRLMVRGTPTIFIDGKLDSTREGYKKLIASDEKKQ